MQDRKVRDTGLLLAVPSPHLLTSRCGAAISCTQGLPLCTLGGKCPGGGGTTYEKKEECLTRVHVARTGLREG